VLLAIRIRPLSEATMTAYIIRRVWQMVPTMLGVVLLVFVLFNWVGGDPAYVLAGKISSQEQIDNIRRQIGVDQPYYVQLGIFFQYFFAYKLGWFPVQGWGDSLSENLFHYALLPILIGLVVSIAPSLRLYRTFVLDEINQDYVRTARAKGVSEGRVMWIHVLRNASIPIITNIMATLPGLLLGIFLVERFFSIPGIGREVILAVERSDFPVIKAITVYVAFATIATNLLADLTYKAVDPRVQLK